MRAEALAAAFAFLFAFASPRLALAFCRTTTVGIPADYDPSPEGCWPSGLPLYWTNACVSYDLQKDASKQISYDDAAPASPRPSRSGQGRPARPPGRASPRPSIDVRDLGPVACDHVQYNQNGPNQHVIVFRDDSGRTTTRTTRWRSRR